VGIIDKDVLLRRVLRLANAVRAEAGDCVLESLPLGSIEEAEQACPIARALCALVIPSERRIVFRYPWYAAAAAKIWNRPFTDALLLSVRLPEALYEFATAFRAGLLPELLQANTRTPATAKVSGQPKKP
jgi:hypothetical protein